MGHFSVEIYAPPGSTLSGNQQARAIVQFEAMGFDQVKLWLQTSPNDGNIDQKMRRSWAIAWLAPHEERVRLEIESSQAEQITIARSARDAAWEAARAAKTANTIATLALIAAAIAIGVSFVALFLS